VTSHLPLGQLLVEAGRIDTVQLSSALAHQRQWGGRLGGALVALGFVAEPELLAVLARQLGVPCVVLGDRYLPPDVVGLVPEKLVRAHKVLPIALATESRRGPLIVATGEPQNLTLLDEIAFVTGKTVKAVLAGDRDLDRAIERHLCPPDAPPQAS
jgi:Type II secretion system (T2SS), protein E, N-terminal domain